jgi:hypothetical protein
MADDPSTPVRAGAILRPAVSTVPRAAGQPINRGDEPAAAEPRWRSDLRLFAITFAGGFVFFLTFLS